MSRETERNPPIAPGDLTPIQRVSYDAVVAFGKIVNKDQ